MTNDHQLVRACASTAPDLFRGERPQPWCSTGLYPQIFVCALEPHVEVSAVEVVTEGVAAMSLRGCQGGRPPADLGCSRHDTQGGKQSHSFTFDPAFWDSLHLVMTAGFGDFCLLTRITLTGKRHKGHGQRSRAAPADKAQCDVINQRLDTARDSLESKWRRRREGKRSRKQAPPLSSPTQQQQAQSNARVDAAA